MAKSTLVRLSDAQWNTVADLQLLSEKKRTGRGGSAIVETISPEILRRFKPGVIAALKLRGVIKPFRKEHRLDMSVIDFDREQLVA